MSTPASRYKSVSKNTEPSFSDLALKGIEKAERSLSKAKNAVKLYKRNPTVFKVGALAVVGLLVYWNRKEDKPEDTITTTSV